MPQTFTMWQVDGRTDLMIQKSGNPFAGDATITFIAIQLGLTPTVG